MAGRITALEPQQRTPDRVNVYLDGEFAFGLAALVAARLQVGAWLSDEAIATLRAADTLEQAHEKALQFLEFRPRSGMELQRYLVEKGFSKEVVEEVLHRLSAVGLVDDRGFSRFWVENRARFRPRGRRALMLELRQKGIAPEDMAAALDGYDESAAAWALAREQARRLAHLPPEQLRRRLSERLARRGFSYDLIQEILAAMVAPADEDETDSGMDFEQESEDDMT